MIGCDYITENYHGEIYHFTSLIQASWIIGDDCLFANIPACEEYDAPYRQDKRKYVNGDMPFISFTRNRNYNVQGGGGTVVKFVFDGDTIQKIRNARLYPYALDNDRRNECEERLYGINIEQLHRYVKRVEIHLSNEIYSWASDREYDEEGEIIDEFSEKYPELDEKGISDKITDYFLSQIKGNHLFSKKVVIYGYNNNKESKTNMANENKLNKLIHNTIRNVLMEEYNIDKNVDLSKEDKRGPLPYIIEWLKLYREYSEKVNKIYDKAYQHYDLSGNFTNDSNLSKETEFKQYFWGKFEDIFENVNENFSQAMSPLFELENEIESSLNKWGEDTYGDKNVYRDYYNDNVL